ncbi:MAG TPA: hypothetical protein VMT74_01925 [Gaiellaceae bacterium]|nr:hypothetical protein [Gaiellaceae bacterium]
MDERYPIGETGSVSVSVLRHEARDAGYPQWSAAIGLRGREATVHVPGHYPGVLARRLRQADERFRPGAKLPAGRDEYLELTALVRDGEETLALSSSARSPVRVSLEVPREELPDLAALLDRAQDLIEELRQGLGLVPDALPDSL